MFPQQEGGHLSGLARSARQVYHSGRVLSGAGHGRGHPRLHRQRLLPGHRLHRPKGQKAVSCDFHGVGQRRDRHSLHCLHAAGPLAAAGKLSQSDSRTFGQETHQEAGERGMSATGAQRLSA